ncbi:DUF6414 family protein [Nocardia nova]
MSIRKGWWKFWMWWRKTSHVRGETGFREFIYLDEISVISLLVSREGEITEQIQEGAASEEYTQLDRTAGASVKALKAESKSSFQTKSSRSVQTTRKANIQSQFRRLHKRAFDDGQIFPGPLPRKEIKDVVALLQSRNLCRLGEDIVRGDVVELEVALEADPIFRAGSVISEFADISDGHPELSRSFDNSLVSEVRSVGRLLERFMAGLVPVRSKVKNVKLYEHDGLQYLVEASVAQRLRLSTREIELVGVSEKDSYWKDIRRVLFSGSTVTVLARINATGIRSSWQPVKLADVFESIAPGSAKALSRLATFDFSNARPAEDDASEIFESTLTVFVDAVAATAEHDITAQERTEIESAVAALKGHGSSLEKQGEAFRKITEKLSGYGISIDPKVEVKLRQEARGRAGELMRQRNAINNSPLSASVPARAVAPALLEVEIIAMYW